MVSTKTRSELNPWQMTQLQRKVPSSSPKRLALSRLPHILRAFSLHLYFKPVYHLFKTQIQSCLHSAPPSQCAPLLSPLSDAPELSHRDRSRAAGFWLLAKRPRRVRDSLLLWKSSLYTDQMEQVVQSAQRKSRRPRMSS